MPSLLKQLIRPYSKISHFLLGSLIISIGLIAILWQGSFASLEAFALALFWILCIFLTQWFGNVYVGLRIDEKWPMLEYPLKRTLYGVIGLVIYSVTAFIIVQMIIHFLIVGKLPSSITTWIGGQIKISLIISFALSVFFSAIGYFKQWRQSEINAQKLKTEMLRYKYESLQNQINPHFLFNSFNVLSELVMEDQLLAREFIQKMSGLYRYVLESKEKELVPLEEELAFIRSFIFLIKTRFEHKLEVTLEVENTTGLYIVPMALQILVENAVKHNMATSSKILKVSINQTADSIRVVNNLQLKYSIETSTKKGLKNLQQQYVFFTKRKILIEKNEEHFLVEIPLLEKGTK